MKRLEIKATYAFAKTIATSFPLAAATAALMSLESEEVTTPLLPIWLVMASIGGTTLSKLYEPDPHLQNAA